MWERDTITQILRNGAAYVVFTKVDGTQRKMLCTMSASLIGNSMPISGPNLNTKRASGPDNVLRVFDLEKNEWRSFRVENVLDIAINDEDLIKNLLVADSPQE